MVPAAENKAKHLSSVNHTTKKKSSCKKEEIRFFVRTRMLSFLIFLVRSKEEVSVFPSISPGEHFE